MHSQHPGKVLQQQYLSPRKLSQNALARAIKVPPRRINEIIHEKRGISADTAVRLGIYFGNSASYWLHLQAQYDIEKVKAQIQRQLATIAAQAAPVPETPLERTTAGVKNRLRHRIMR